MPAASRHCCVWTGKTQPLLLSLYETSTIFRLKARQAFAWMMLSSATYSLILAHLFPFTEKILIDFGN